MITTPPHHAVSSDEWHAERIVDVLTSGRTESVLCVVEIIHTRSVPIAHTFFALPRSGGVRGIQHTMDRSRDKVVDAFGVSVSRDLGADVPKVVLFSPVEIRKFPERDLSVLYRVHHRFPNARHAVEAAVRGMRPRWSYTVTPTGVRWRPPEFDSEGMLARFFQAHTDIRGIAGEMWFEGMLALYVDHRPDPRHGHGEMPYTTPYLDTRNSSWCNITELPLTWRRDVGKSETTYVDKDRGQRA